MGAGPTALPRTLKKPRVPPVPCHHLLPAGGVLGGGCCPIGVPGGGLGRDGWDMLGGVVRAPTVVPSQG